MGVILSRRIESFTITLHFRTVYNGVRSSFKSHSLFLTMVMMTILLYSHPIRFYSYGEERMGEFFFFLLGNKSGKICRSFWTIVILRSSKKNIMDGTYIHTYEQIAALQTSAGLCKVLLHMELFALCCRWTSRCSSLARSSQLYDSGGVVIAKLPTFGLCLV